ncbi:hypothetical protein HJG54_08895 [Leptolyngbya sp. NK1-12]|uniref:Uncharacterized protein n=1 Tax=Leptolyngbya sp. NK1-12 TaxID=2547451 RepID=A0AA97AHQ4_9CYAN|nr:hypothetical protein [Leptolyngbya sp. NK1-12]WNZ22966.1 hypothetical protein HJG54_08895 [Leptolyngbya sp. NK1-12]
MLNWIKRVVRQLFGRTQTSKTNHLITLSSNLAGAFGFGLKISQPEPEADTWTSEKLVQMSENLSHIHPGL